MVVEPFSLEEAFDLDSVESTTSHPIACPAAPCLGPAKFPMEPDHFMLPEAICLDSLVSEPFECPVAPRLCAAKDPLNVDPFFLPEAFDLGQSDMMFALDSDYADASTQSEVLDSDWSEETSEETSSLDSMNISDRLRSKAGMHPIGTKHGVNIKFNTNFSRQTTAEPGEDSEDVDWDDFFSRDTALSAGTESELSCTLPAKAFYQGMAEMTFALNAIAA